LRTAIRELAELGEGDIAARRFPGSNPDAQAGLGEILDASPRRDDRRSPAERRFAVAEAMRWALERGAERAAPHRAILAIDELHRVDALSRQAFSDALGEPPAIGALILASHVPGFETGWSAEKASARVLSGLPPAAVSRLVHDARPSERKLGVEADTGRGL